MKRDENSWLACSHWMLECTMFAARSVEAIICCQGQAHKQSCVGSVTCSSPNLSFVSFFMPHSKYSVAVWHSFHYIKMHKAQWSSIGAVKKRKRKQFFALTSVRTMFDCVNFFIVSWCYLFLLFSCVSMYYVPPLIYFVSSHVWCST